QMPDAQLPSSPQGSPSSANRSTQAPSPSQRSVTSHADAMGGPQGVPGGAWFARHTPCPSQVSGASHSLSDGSPQGVLVGAKFGRQLPRPSQVSGASHSLSSGLPQGVPRGLSRHSGEAASTSPSVEASSKRPESTGGFRAASLPQAARPSAPKSTKQARREAIGRTMERLGSRPQRPRKREKPTFRSASVGHEGFEPSANGLRIHCSTS